MCGYAHRDDGYCLESWKQRGKFVNGLLQILPVIDSRAEDYLPVYSDSTARQFFQNLHYVLRSIVAEHLSS